MAMEYGTFFLFNQRMGCAQMTLMNKARIIGKMKVCAAMIPAIMMITEAIVMERLVFVEFISIE
jgi:hypothetical protein